jgi:hypothetical protein
MLARTASAALGTAVEFYHAGFNHYFLTASPGEAAALDAGAFNKSWSRTGGQFTVYTDPAPGCLRCAASGSSATDQHALLHRERG